MNVQYLRLFLQSKRVAWTGASNSLLPSHQAKVAQTRWDCSPFMCFQDAAVTRVNGCWTTFGYGGPLKLLSAFLSALMDRSATQPNSPRLLMPASDLQH